MTSTDAAVEAAFAFVGTDMGTTQSQERLSVAEDLIETVGRASVERFRDALIVAKRHVEVRRQFLREHPGHVLDSWPLPAD